MGKAMDKATLIYGQGNGVPVGSVNWTSIQEAITAEIGPEPVAGLSAAKKAVTDAKADKSLQNAYVKVGLVGSDLVLRIKDKRTLLDKEIDTTLIKGYKGKQADYQRVAKLADESDMTAPDPAVVKKMVFEINASIDAQLPNPSQVEGALTALKAGDRLAATTKVGGLAKKVRTGLDSLRRLDTFVKETCNAKGWDARHVDLKQFAAKQASVVGVLRKTEADLEKMEAAIDKMEAEAPAPTVTDPNAGRAYQDEFGKILRANTAIVGSLQGAVTHITPLVTQAQQLAAAGEAAKTAEVASKVLMGASMVDTQFRKLHKAAVDLHYPMRKGLGDSETSNMTNEDKAKTFTPMNTKSMDLLGKMLGKHNAIVAALEPVADGIGQRFPELRAAALEVVGKLNAANYMRQ